MTINTQFTFYCLVFYVIIFYVLNVVNSVFLIVTNADAIPLALLLLTVV